MLQCASCGTQVAETASFCPNCGKAMTRPGSAASAPGQMSAPAPAQSHAGLADNVAGMLAYVTIIPAIAFLILEPYNKRRFVRFHAFQCLFFALACVVASFALRILAFMPVIRWTTLMLWPLLGLAEFILWVICLLKAYQGQMFKLPVIGDLAEEQASKGVAGDNSLSRAA